MGCLLYIAKQTRPDILATVSRLSRYLENPGKVHWMAAKRVLRYLKGTRDLGLTFRRDADGLQLFEACDADWASDVDDRRSTTGFAFMVQKEGAAISWNSKKQPTAELLSISLKDTTLHRIMLRHHHIWYDSRHGLLGISMHFKESGATSILYVN